MHRFKNFLILSFFVSCQLPLPGFSMEIISYPGDRAEFAFTVNNTEDSVGTLENPEIVYADKPWWFNMGGRLSYPSIPPGKSQEMVLEYTIADDAPPGIYTLDFKVKFTNPNIFPPFWKPAEDVDFIIKGPGFSSTMPRPKRAKKSALAPVRPPVEPKKVTPAAPKKEAPVYNSSGWPDINYGNRCQSTTILPDNKVIRDAASGSNGVKIRFKIFTNEPNPCKDGELCRIHDCQTFQDITKDNIPCVSTNSKVFISPCKFKSPSYPQNIVSAVPSIASLNSKVREKTIDSADLSAPQNIAMVTAALSDTSPDVRLMAVLRLDELDGDQAVNSLCYASTDRNTIVAYYAVKALGVINSTKTVQCLQKARLYPDADVRGEAAFWLYTHHCDIERRGDSWETTRVLPKEICREMSFGFERNENPHSLIFKKPFTEVEPYLTALKEGDLNAKYHALSMGANLNICNNRVAVKPLLSAMEDSDGAVRWGAAMALEHFADPRSVATLVAGLKSPVEDVRMMSATALAPILEHIKAYEAFLPLMELAKDPNQRTQSPAVKALGRFKAEDAADLLADLATHDNGDTYMYREAVTALASIQTDKSKNLLIAMLDGSNFNAACMSAYALNDEFYSDGLNPKQRERVSAVISGRECHAR